MQNIKVYLTIILIIIKKKNNNNYWNYWKKWLEKNLLMTSPSDLLRMRVTHSLRKCGEETAELAVFLRCRSVWTLKTDKVPHNVGIWLKPVWSDSRRQSIPGEKRFWGGLSGCLGEFRRVCVDDEDEDDGSFGLSWVRFGRWRVMVSDAGVS